MSNFFLITGKNKIYTLVITFVIMAISAVSAWRLLAILSSRFAFPLRLPASPSRFAFVLLALTLGFILFWLAILYGIAQLRPKKGSSDSAQRLLTATIGALSFGLLALLLTTPVGLSRVTVELYAENVWSPQSFTLSWLKNGVWEAPFSLPSEKSAPATLEIVTGEQAQTLGEVWLVKAVWPDGRSIPAEEFQAEGGWQQHEIDWATYTNQPVWLARSQQPASLRWQGSAPGPLTLVFAKHDRAGQVTIRWNGSEQTIDLFAPTIEFAGLTLPTSQPVVWRATLPLSALEAEEMDISIAPDPGGNYSAIIQKLRVTGVPGQDVEISGPQLLETLQVKGGRAEQSATGGVQFMPNNPDQPLQVLVAHPFITDLTWSRLIPWLENGLLILYLAVIGFLALGGLAQRLSLSFLTAANRLAISFIIILFIGEMGPRLYFPSPGHYYVWTPNLHQIFRPDPQALPGIHGESNFITNSQGIRGDDFLANDDYRILTIGASTTECLYLDQTEAWPQLVQAGLNDSLAAKDTQVWVGNIGKSARKTPDHIVQLKYLLPQYPKLDAVILLLGASDLFLTLRWEDSPDNPYHSTAPGAQQAALKRAFDVVVDQSPYSPYYQQTAAWRIISKAWASQAQVAAAEEIEVEDEAGRVYIERREKRKSAPIVDKVPDLSASLSEYSRNINSIIDIAQAHDLRVILMTQPTLWRSDLTQAEADLLWLGQGPGRKYFYSAGALAQMMSMYNQRLLEICDQRQVECIDLAPVIPKNTTIFYDDAHYTEEGARQVAKVVTDYLLSQPPFSLK